MSQDRYGSARFAEFAEVAQAGLLKGTGLYLGEFAGRPIHIDSSASILTLGGAGAGKLSTILARNLCLSSEKIAFLDPKGEGCAISLDNQARFGIPAYAYNPYRMHDLPSMTINPTGFIRKGAITLTADLKTLFEDLIATSGADSAQFFEQSARAAAEMFGLYDVEKHGTLSLPRVYRAIMTMIGNGPDWEELAMDIAAVAPLCMVKLKELIQLQSKGERTFSNVAAELTNAFAWMSDPAMMASLSDAPDIDIEAFCTDPQPARLYIIIPAELLSVNAPFLRLMFSAMMIVKARHPSAPRLNLIVDEAGQLGPAPFLSRAFSFGRGVGIKSWAVFQDAGQITRHYGQSGIQSFMASAEVRQVFGVRDADTAALVAKMCGNKTVHYVDEYRAQEAELAKRRARQAFLRAGEDAFEAVLDAKHFHESLQLSSQTGRPLLEISEVLGLGEQEQILFVSGRNIPPIRAQRAPYWTQSAMAGQFMPNPYHPPLDQVQIATRWGMRSHRIIEERVPALFAHLPQYQDRPFLYVEGFRPNVGR